MRKADQQGLWTATGLLSGYRCMAVETARVPSLIGPQELFRDVVDYA